MTGQITFNSHYIQKMVVPAPQYIVTARLLLHLATGSEHACMQSVVCQIYYSFSYNYKFMCAIFIYQTLHTYTL